MFHKYRNVSHLSVKFSFISFYSKTKNYNPIVGQRGNRRGPVQRNNNQNTGAADKPRGRPRRFGQRYFIDKLFIEFSILLYCFQTIKTWWCKWKVKRWRPSFYKFKLSAKTTSKIKRAIEQ